MSWFEALILGLIQGITEFFPISSSAHFKLAQHFFGLSPFARDLYFEMTCNMGTVLAMLFYFRKEITDLWHSRHKLYLLALAILPLFPAYFIYHFFKSALCNDHLLGYFLILTALLLFAAARFNFTRTDSKYKDALIIGFMQSLALLPGFSRSASTISAACFRGWPLKEAISFSFLLAIPAILGGHFLETLQLLFLREHAAVQVNLTSYAIGFMTSLGTGLLTMRYILSLTDKKRVRPFAWYCLIIGVATCIYFS